MHKPLSRSLLYAWVAGVLLAALSCGGGGGSSSPPTSPLVSWPADGSFTAALDAVVPDRLARYGIPGASIVLIENGQVGPVKAYGEALTESHAPMTAETVFQLASITKTVTTWGVLHLVEKGVLDLDSPVEPHLTRWHWPASRFDSSGVTVRRLLSHTAGFSVHGYLGWPPDIGLPSLEESLNGTNNGSGPVELIQEPGAAFLYSGGGYTILQLLVEEVTQEPFATFMAREVVGPLGLTSTSYLWRDDLRPRTAGAYGSQSERLPNYLFTEEGAASLYATGPDLARFVVASMTGPGAERPGRGVISPESVTLARTPAPASGGGYGLGVEIWPVVQGVVVGHGGGNRGWRTRWVAIPERGVGLVILTNSENGQTLTNEVDCEWMRRTAGGTAAWCG
jgi:CubicO group peptidase (beta-lactamase class C family)